VCGNLFPHRLNNGSFGFGLGDKNDKNSCKNQIQKNGGSFEDRIIETEMRCEKVTLAIWEISICEHCNRQALEADASLLIH